MVIHRIKPALVILTLMILTACFWVVPSLVAADCRCESVNCDCDSLGGGDLISRTAREICQNWEAQLKTQCEQNPSTFTGVCDGEPHGPKAWPTSANRREFPPECGWGTASAVLLGLAIAALVAGLVIAGAVLLAPPVLGALVGPSAATAFTTSFTWTAALKTIAVSTAAGGVAVLAKSWTATEPLTTAEIIYEAGVVSGSMALGGWLLRSPGALRFFNDLDNPVLQGAITGAVVSAPRALFDWVFTDKSLGRVVFDVALGSVFGGAAGWGIPPEVSGGAHVLSETASLVAGFFASITSNIMDIVLAIGRRFFG